jgi:hypothetical protein
MLKIDSKFLVFYLDKLFLLEIFECLTNFRDLYLNLMVDWVYHCFDLMVAVVVTYGASPFCDGSGS